MKAFAVGGLVACLGCLPAWANCAAPKAPPQPPDGATAGREEMVLAMHAIQDYDAAVKAFQDCASRTSSEFERENAQAAVDRLVVLADRFNSELIAFKKKNSE